MTKRIYLTDDVNSLANVKYIDVNPDEDNNNVRQNVQVLFNRWTLPVMISSAQGSNYVFGARSLNELADDHNDELHPAYVAFATYWVILHYSRQKRG